MAKPKWNFFIIAVEELEHLESNVAYGIAYNTKRVIQWSYDFKLSRVELYDSLATTEFYQALEDFLKSEENNIKSGFYDYDFARIKKASEILTKHDLKKQAYGIKE